MSPLLYVWDAHAWCDRQSKQLGHSTTLDDVPESELLAFKDQGFEMVWLIGAWTIGPLSREVPRANQSWHDEMRKSLPDLSIDDIQGSTFAISAYEVSARLGGNKAMSRLHKRLNKLGIKLILDFVPNHTGLDHHWTKSHPEYFVSEQGTPLNLAPELFTKLGGSGNAVNFAHGRDPYFPPWVDTLQLDYAKPSLCKAMTEELTHVASLCDGVRCDLAMLMLPEIFHRTWGVNALQFWPDAIATVRKHRADFIFLAEVYWDYEETLLRLGFDYVYDKKPYDFLKANDAPSFSANIKLRSFYLSQGVHFLENHDEQRAATAFSLGQHKAAALLSYLMPGVRFFHDGQLEGACLKPSAHLRRRAKEEKDSAIHSFYESLLRLLRDPIFHAGRWVPLECFITQAQPSIEVSVCSYLWELENKAAVIIVNYSKETTHCELALPGHIRPAKLAPSQFYAELFANPTFSALDQTLELSLGPWECAMFESNLGKP